MTIDEALQIAEDIRNPDVVDSYKRVREALLVLANEYARVPDAVKDFAMIVNFPTFAHEPYRTLA